MSQAVATGASRGRRQGQDDRGVAMVALLVALSIMAVALSVALPTWKTQAQREREAELVFRGEQYARAISLYQRKYANAFPTTVDVLVEQKFLRRKYLDPITGSDFQTILVGQATPGRTGGAGAQAGAGQTGGGSGTVPQLARGRGATTGGLTATPTGTTAGIQGVTSKSDATSFRDYKGRTVYNQWAFIATAATTQAGGANGSQTPNGGVGGRGTGGQQGQPAGRGNNPNQPGNGQRGFQPFGGGQGQPQRGGPQPFGTPQPFGGPPGGGRR